MLKEDINLIGEFDQSRVSVQEPVFPESFRTVWYDITSIVKSLAGDKTPSVLDYVVKIEAEVCYLYREDDDYLSQAKEEYEEIIDAQYRHLGCFQGDKGLRIRNDARRIRLTFANGSTMVVTNSEWGSILLG